MEQHPRSALVTGASSGTGLPVCYVPELTIVRLAV